MLENLKKDVCEIAKRAQQTGLCKHKSGNFSARDQATGYIVITPTSVDRELLTPRDMVVMDKNACVLENLSGLKPTSEALMHLKIYETRPDAMAIAHTHSVYATTFALLNKPIPAIVYEVANLGVTKGRIPVAPYGRPGTVDLANSIVNAAKESECFLMEKHGVVGFDSRNIYEAYLKAAYVEELAQLYFNALAVSGGKEPNAFPQEELASWEYPKEIHWK
ncbi:class II aldolase/adducin family protein [Absicoccus intestinalis]|uniref:Class II aldolase/adducin family protein n=1 Tax=Absicoccus intestinalis TaxID=2926319 RepID=A0ABU4WL82_9FIRM|nr:class II aldolase/adducin family protein [Absicoccus sp. CLA-KB-P134]MDX8417305.1 class II aldolase/adducin family protein [Absicoccus sp. CLA-KB-P134]